jgi:hypothetical protein
MHCGISIDSAIFTFGVPENSDAGLGYRIFRVSANSQRVDKYNPCSVEQLITVLEQFGRDCDFNIALEYAVPFADDNINIGEKSDVYNVGCRWKLCTRLVSRDICGRLVF